MGKLFGTDGIRGVVGENLTADMAFRVGQAIATVLEEEKGSRPTLVIGKDTRISSDMLESALMAGICSVGGDVKPVGTIPTPAVAYLTVQERADAGIVISASHNPYEHNGIKVFSGQGYKLSDAVEGRIEEKILSQEPMKVRTRGEIGRRHHGMRQLKRDYIDFVASTIESDLAGLKILVDCANGAASATAPELFGRFKARTDFIHRDPDGVNINSRCGSTHLEDLSAAVVKGGYDIGVAFDGDADRCLLVDTGFRQDPCRQALFSQLKELGLAPGDVDVLLTHLHSDHSGLAPEAAGEQTIYISEVDRLSLDDRAYRERYWNTMEDRFREEGFPRHLMANMNETNPAYPVSIKGDTLILQDCSETGYKYTLVRK